MIGVTKAILGDLLDSVTLSEEITEDTSGLSAETRIWFDGAWYRCTLQELPQGTVELPVPNFNDTGKLR